MNARELMSQMGLGGKEIDIFLIGTMLGPQPASVIADKLSLNRITTYIILKRMVGKHLATSVIKNGMHYFEMADQARLRQLAQKKESGWREIQEHIPVLLSKFIVQTPEEKMGLKVLQGIDHVLLALQSVAQHNLLAVFRGTAHKPPLYEKYLDSLINTQQYSIPLSFDVYVTNDSLTLIVLFYENCCYGLQIVSKQVALELRLLINLQSEKLSHGEKLSQTALPLLPYPGQHMQDHQSDLAHLPG